MQIALAAAHTPAHNRARTVEIYTPGHSESVSDFMARRTLASHGEFFVPHLQPGLRLLDCGCGPGSCCDCRSGSGKQSCGSTAADHSDHINSRT